jgi:diguanylate cyclase (GGDEF)-like protein/PAS domain S-box-containing protein
VSVTTSPHYGLALCRRARRDRLEVAVEDLPTADVDRRASATTEQRWFRALLQNATDALEVLDRHGRFVFASPGAQALLGIPADDLVGMLGTELLHPDDVGLATRRFEELLAGPPGADTRFEIRIQRPTGEIRWIQLVMTNRLDDPAVEGVVVNAHDTTESREAQREADRLTQVLTATSDLVAITDAEGHLLYMNQAAKRFFRVADDFATFSFTDATPPWAQVTYRRETLPALESDGIWSGEFAYLRGGVEVAVSALFIAHRDTAGAIETISSISRDISERKALEARLAHQATHDPLTGLPNRLLLLDRLEVALARSERSGRRVAVLFLDLDHFKVVNDSLGHTCGDELLVTVAARLRAVVRPGDTVARFGGDEFVVLCEDITQDGDAHTIAERVHEALAEPVRLGETDVHTTASAGLAFSRPGTSNGETLIRDADAAMYRAKGRGRARYEVFDVAMREQAVDRLEIERTLRRAIDRRELRVVYQPVIDIDSGLLVGAEALVRWDHPERGVLNPDEFLPVAEETGLIVPLGLWVAEQACRQAIRWSTQVGDGFRPWISVNLSARQLEHPDLVDDLAAILDRTGIDPSLVVLEITESVAMADVSSTTAVFDRLKWLGVRLSIDDFGTGYSSLAYLRRFPVDELKVDREFVADIARNGGDHTIVRAIVSMAHSLGLRVTAEGVETEEQLRRVRASDCDRAQGFLFSSPSRPEAVTDLMRSRSG